MMMAPMNNRLMRPRQSGYVAPDADARAYIARVEAEDGQKLEPAVAKAINDFVAGLKSDGIFDAIKASCILMGARTLEGALEPLVGSAPTNTNNNFVSADYNRKTGLKGNGSTKWLDSNRAADADTQNSHHFSLYVTEAQTSGGSGAANSFPRYIGAAASAVIRNVSTGGVQSATVWFNNRNTTLVAAGNADDTGFIATNRSASDNYDIRIAGATTNTLTGSNAPSANNHRIFGGESATFSNGRIAFYSIGSALPSGGLALLDTRVSALYTAIGAALP